MNNFVPLKNKIFWEIGIGVAIFYIIGTNSDESPFSFISSLKMKSYYKEVLPHQSK